ncbi:MULTISPECIES: hypothetical protein [Chryseobacterium]|uniref:Uncharacterized protein n=1 Tax=Chryseobacterium bernardetii TaxID=1241978 RepID=A0A3G6TBD1_9FLAO|nr:MULTISPECIES: hypothetical protein [Chryseobacterium]AZB23350.1 hypothetical protein EG339_01295 [Chryseobacterium bernardetii]AZB34126.1 hypothetical protein EG351_11160 [Chryseobacterium bernardetii]UCA57750.1 hypothetical protein KB553_11820 [Chryseobacterium rhizoplanae]
MKDLNKKLKVASFESNYGKLSKKSMLSVFGGGSCGATGSSSGCDATAVCGCVTQTIKKPKAFEDGIE